MLVVRRSGVFFGWNWSLFKLGWVCCLLKDISFPSICSSVRDLWIRHFLIKTFCWKWWSASSKKGTMGWDSLLRWWFLTCFFIFTPIWGRFPFWRSYFSKGLKPPTRFPCLFQKVQLFVLIVCFSHKNKWFPQSNSWDMFFDCVRKLRPKGQKLDAMFFLLSCLYFWQTSEHKWYKCLLPSKINLLLTTGTYKDNLIWKKKNLIFAMFTPTWGDAPI